MKSRITLEQIEADPTLRSRDDDGVMAIAVGTMAWTLALVAVLIWGSAWGVDTDRWTLVCALGVLLGIPGLALVLGRRRRRSRQS